MQALGRRSVYAMEVLRKIRPPNIRENARKPWVPVPKPNSAVTATELLPSTDKKNITKHRNGERGHRHVDKK